MFEYFKALKRISRLEESVETLQRQLKGAILDNDDLFDRLKRMSGRLAKRADREENAEQQDPQTVGESGTTMTGLSPVFSKLTPRQRQLQMNILNRRANGGSA